MNTNFVIYCDMDGVLINFRSTIINLINHSLYEKEIFCADEKMVVRELRQMYNNRVITVREFLANDDRNNYLISFMFWLLKNNITVWTDLPWTKDGKELWQFLIMNYKNVRILSAPAYGKAYNASIRGKCQWIQRNLGHPLWKCHFHKEKYIFADRNAILIDDRDDNIELFKQAGGKGILHKNTEFTKLVLRNFFL